MGIPGFASRMQTYAVPKEISPTKAERSEGHTITAIVDGPALAHHLLRKIKDDGLADATIVTHCDYAELGRAAVRFLDLLTSYGFIVLALIRLILLMNTALTHTQRRYLFRRRSSFREDTCPKGTRGKSDTQYKDVQATAR